MPAPDGARTSRTRKQQRRAQCEAVQQLERDALEVLKSCKRAHAAPVSQLHTLLGRLLKLLPCAEPGLRAAGWLTYAPLRVLPLAAEPHGRWRCRRQTWLRTAHGAAAPPGC